MSKTKKTKRDSVHWQNAQIRCNGLSQARRTCYALCAFKRKAQQHKQTIRPTATHASQHRLVEGAEALPAPVYQWEDQL